MCSLDYKNDRELMKLCIKSDSLHLLAEFEIILLSSNMSGE